MFSRSTAAKSPTFVLSSRQVSKLHELLISTKTGEVDPSALSIPLAIQNAMCILHSSLLPKEIQVLCFLLLVLNSADYYKSLPTPVCFQWPCTSKVCSENDTIEVREKPVPWVALQNFKFGHSSLTQRGRSQKPEPSLCHCAVLTWRRGLAEKVKLCFLPV